MKKMEQTADFTLWTPWGPEFKKSANSRAAALHKTLGRMKQARLDVDKRDREDLSAGKPECAYEP